MGVMSLLTNQKILILQKKEFFKIAKMEPHEAHNYIIKEYGRCEVNYFHFIMLDQIIPLSWFMIHPWIPEKYR